MDQVIAVLIPCFNEEATITNVIKDFQQYLPDSIIYVYNNCSTDNTASLATMAGAIVKDAPIKGKGNTVKQMFQEVDADIYVIIDGDSTYFAKDAQNLIEPITQGYDMVVGNRLASTYFTENKSLLRSFGNRIVPWLIRKLFKVNISDIMTGYRAFSKAFVKNINIQSKFFEIETEITIHAITNHYKIDEIPIDYKDRPAGSKSKLNTIKDGAKVIFFILKEYIKYAKTEKTKRN